MIVSSTTVKQLAEYLAKLPAEMPVYMVTEHQDGYCGDDSRAYLSLDRVRVTKDEDAVPGSPMRSTPPRLELVCHLKV